MWQFGEGWLDAMEQRNDRRFETPWNAPYADLEIGGSGAKPLITHRQNCEYWYDVSAQLGTGPTTQFSGTLDAPDGVVDDSLEIVGAGGEFVTEQGGEMRSSVDNSTVGSLDLATGAYSVTRVNAVPGGTAVHAYFRSRPPGDGTHAQFRIGSPAHDDPNHGVYHVGVAEPLFVELLVDTTNDVLEIRVTTPDGRFDDTVVSRSNFCDSASAAAIRPNSNPYRFGDIFYFAEPFWALPLTTVPDGCWHQVGQWRITGATDGAPLSAQGPPAGFVRR